MVNKIFGIISWLPDKEPDRSQRINRLNNMLTNLKHLFPSVPIMVIAQNWKDYRAPLDDLTIYSYDRLGILKARRTLRKRFIESNYECLIMMDDDAMIKCNDGSAYLKEIDDHPGCVGLFRENKCPLMLLAISKEIYKQIDMPDVDPEKDQGYEDDVFVATLIHKFPDKVYHFSHATIEETSFRYNGIGAVPSTWAHAKPRNWSQMNENTHNIITKLKNG